MPSQKKSHLITARYPDFLFQKFPWNIWKGLWKILFINQRMEVEKFLTKQQKIINQQRPASSKFFAKAEIIKTWNIVNLRKRTYFSSFFIFSPRTHNHTTKPKSLSLSLEKANNDELLIKIRINFYFTLIPLRKTWESENVTGYFRWPTARVENVRSQNRFIKRQETLYPFRSRENVTQNASRV